jgi:hypothetical protein
MGRWLDTDFMRSLLAPSPSRFWRPSSIHQPGLTQVLLYCQHTSCTLTTRDPSAITSSSSSAATSSSSPSVLTILAVPICTASYYCNYCNYCSSISTSTSAYSPLAQPTPARCTAKKKNTPTGIICAVPATYKRVLALVSGASHKAFNVACGVCSPDKTRLQTWP